MSEVPLYGSRAAWIPCIPGTVAYLRLIDSCITQLKAQGPSRTCNESKEEDEDSRHRREHTEAFTEGNISWMGTVA